MANRVIASVKAFSRLLLLATLTASAALPDSVQWVNPYIGTGSGPIGYGGTMPFVTPPFGMTDWTPQTRQNRLSVTSYKYEDQYIQGFIGTHQPAIWMGDYGYVTIIPQVGPVETNPERRQMAFTHDAEHARPYLYSVEMTTKSQQHI